MGLTDLPHAKSLPHQFNDINLIFFLFLLLFLSFPLPIKESSEEEVVEETPPKKTKKKRVLTIKRRAYKNLYRNRRRRAVHSNSAEQQEGDIANEELPAGFSAEATADISVTLNFPPEAFEKQFEREEGDVADQEPDKLENKEEATIDGPVIKDIDDAASFYSGYLPAALLRRPTPSVIGELPALAKLVQDHLPSISDHLKKKSSVYYKTRVPNEKVEISLPTVSPQRPEEFIERFKKRKIPLRRNFYEAPPTYRQHRAEQRYIQRYRQKRQEVEKEYEKEVARRRAERERRHHRENIVTSRREAERRREERERRQRTGKSNDPALPDELVAAPKIPAEDTSPAVIASTSGATRQPRAHRDKEDDAISLCASSPEHN